MGRMLVISDDLSRSAQLTHGLAPDAECCILDLFGDALPDEAATALVTDVANLDPRAVRRLQRVLTQTRRGVPLVVLLSRDTPHARLQALALGATRTLSPPFDASRLREALRLADGSADALGSATVRSAEASRQFLSQMIVPDRPISPAIAENGTMLVAQAVRESGIRDWIRAVRRFDDMTHQHCLLVAGLAAAFATGLGLAPADRHRLTRAALLHDVGKIHVPAAILNKPGRLDEDEMALIRRHPELGEAMLADQGFEPELLSVVRSHHEMLDGSGYPDRLEGEAIPDLVRLVTICDIYGALIERRAYKPPMAAEAAYAILESMMGRLDPVLVQAFRPVAGEFTLHIPCDA